MVRFPPSSRPWRRSIAFVLAGLMVFLVACGGKTDAEDMPAATLDRGDSSTTTPAAATTPTAERELTVEEEVEAAYLEANRVFYTIMEDPYQPLDQLQETRTGPSLDKVSDAVEGRREGGRKSSYPNGYPVAEVLEIEVTGDFALITACEVSDAIVTGSDGSIVNDDVVTRRNEVDLEYSDGRWKVAGEYQIEKFPGQRTCDD